MSTFLELYETLLAFINFKLYAELNLVYPPRIDTAKDAAGGGMNALILEQLDQEQLQVQVANDSNVPKLANDLSAHALRSLEKKIDSIDSSKDAAQVTSSKVDLETPQPVVAPTSIQETVVHVNFADEIAPGKQLFSNCVFWLSREVPRYSLEFVIKAFGGQVGWDASAGACSPFLESDPRITHQIVDRPQAAASENTRELLQPQWVYDCCNASILLKTDGYHPGETLPPHLSPFVKHGQEDYNPAEQVAPDAPVEEQIDVLLY